MSTRAKANERRDDSDGHRCAAGVQTRRLLEEVHGGCRERERVNPSTRSQTRPEERERSMKYSGKQEH